MRPRWPRTLLGQNVLLLLGAMLVSQVAGVVVFLVFVQTPRVRDAATLFAGQIATLQRLLSEVTPAQRDVYARRLGGQASLPPPAPDAGRYAPIQAYESQLFLHDVAARLPPGTGLRWLAGATPGLWVRLDIAGQGYWITLPVNRSDRFPGVLVALSLSFILSALAALCAFLVHRRINRPLRQLVAAADRLSGGERPAPLALIGPTEIAIVASAFNRMMVGLADIEATRAVMLAGISHDIRTPLTKLRLALVMPELAAAPLAHAERYIDDIDAIVQQFIDYARGGDGEAFAAGDLNALIEQLAADFAGLGHDFALTLAALPALAYRPVSMLRLLLNLMQNAALYGQRELAVSSRADAHFVYVSVRDGGPGIAPALLPLIKQPFRRGETGTSGGTGLGLAIAHRIAEQHGGRLDLALPAGGGFLAQLRLPLCRDGSGRGPSVDLSA